MSVLAMIVGLVVATMGTAVQAMPLPSPSGEVVLTIRGDIEHPNVGDEARFDRAMLDRLPSRTIVTRTPWQPGTGRFEGPLFSALLEAVGANGDEVRVRALNGFEADIPVSDFERYDVILAMRRNGEPMTIRNFGPLFVVYPFEEHPELMTEAIRFRSVWQVHHIFVY
ncbi:molybdopterin-dependent oxidoreductase [Halomonas caseinilytica]|uniref:Oxidoreductase molybdopterin-binding domain-containing protein n=1 Tax=Halomonas caseinilytica TaxID=438744 RepID=A0A1M6R6N6_9GAMM|nr:hypothetical protein SAMN04487952_101234 [Halomonas caseinilytica]SHK28122.1 hypothetical protein SAMN05192556_102233 [Halomonas caseinilytica]